MNFFTRVTRALLRGVLVLAGLVLLASLLVAALVLVVFALARGLWCRLTGRPVPTWRFSMGGAGVDPVAQWSRFQAASSRWTAAPDTPSRSARALEDVTDVEVKPRGERPSA